VIESIWQISTITNTKNNAANTVVVPLRTFIQEVLKRSRTTYSTLQTALFYLFRARPQIKLQLETATNGNWEDAYISCGRRMFLASLVVASKFVQDKTYRNSAWAKIAGLPVSEINAAERIFLNMIDYRLYISQPTFEQWHHLLHLHVENKTLGGGKGASNLLNDFNALVQQSGIHSPPQPFYYYNSQQHTPQQLHNITNIHHITTTANHIHYNNNNNNNPNINTHYTIISPTTPLSSNQNTPSPRTPPRSQNTNKSGWTIVLSPTAFLSGTAQQPQQAQPTRKRQRCCYSNKLPLLSMSLPSSINSSPMQTPTQISPVRVNIHGNATSVFNWTTPPAVAYSSDNGKCSKKRKFASSTIIETTPNNNNTSCYNISHVRQRYNNHS
jgi:hypothetical protein